VSDAEAQLAQLQRVHKDARLLREGGNPVVLLPGFAFRAAGQTETMDLLLVPWNHGGYMTRLFFERALSHRGRNWTTHRVVERTWWTPSYNDVQPTLPWREMLCAHVRSVA
jgi:hypothetical protein